MKINLKQKYLAIVLSIFTVASNVSSSFAHNAVYYDFLVGDNFDYQVVPRDDMQSSSEANHLEWAPEIGGYFYQAGTVKNRPLFVFAKDSLTSESTADGIKFRAPEDITDSSAEEDRTKYYDKYTKHEDNGGLSKLGKTHTLPPTNAINQSTKKYLHLTTSSAELGAVTNRIYRMINNFNQLLYYAAPGENPGDYSSYQGDFMATAEILSDAISNLDELNSSYIGTKNGHKYIVVPIPVDDTRYNSVEIEIIGRTYNWSVTRYDGRKYTMKNAVRSVHTGFKYKVTVDGESHAAENAGDFWFGGDYHETTDKQEDGKFNLMEGFLGLFKYVPSTQKFAFKSDITLCNTIVTANTKMAVYGTSAKNAYSTRDESLLGRELTKAITSLIDTLTSLLKMQDYSELIYNTGARNPQSYVLKFDGSFNYTGDALEEGTLEYVQNDPYMLGIYRLSWQQMVAKFNAVFLVFGLMVIAFSLVKLLLHAQTIALSPYFRHEAYKSILNYIIVSILLPLTWIIFVLLAQANYYITTIFGSAVNYQSITQIGVSGASGTLGGIAIGICYFTTLIYFNVVYVIRSINIAILMATAPLVISTLTLGPKYKNIFDTWLKEVVSNIFLQSFHAFILTFIVSAQSASSGVESVVLVMGMIPLTSMFRGMFLGGNTVGVGEQLGSRARNVANAGVALTGMAAFRLGAAGLSGAAGVVASGADVLNNSESFKNFLGSKFTDSKDRDKIHASLDKFSSKAKTVQRNAKPIGESLGKIATGGALALSTDGQSLQTAMQGIENLGLSTLDGASKKISDKITNTRESALDVKTLLGQNGKSMTSTKDEIISEYNLNKRQSETLQKIMSSPATNEEKQTAARAFLEKENFRTSGNSKISYDENSNSVAISEKNINGVRVSTVGDKVVMSGGDGMVTTLLRANKSNKTSTGTSEYDNSTLEEEYKKAHYSDNYNNLVKKQVAATIDEGYKGDIDTLKVSNNNGTAHVSYNKMGESTSTSSMPLGNMSGTIKQFVDNDPQVIKADNSIVVPKSGSTQNLTKVDVTPKEITTYQNMDKDFQQKLVSAMQSCKTEEERIQVRDDLIKNKYGENASFSKDYNTIGQIKIEEKNNSNIRDIQVDKNGSLIVKTFDSAPIMFKELQETKRTQHSTSNIVHSALNSNSQAPEKITTDANVFGNSKSLDISKAYTSDINNNVYIPVTEDVNKDLESYYNNNKDKFQGNEAGLIQALNEHAFKTHKISNIESSNNGSGYVINVGSSNINVQDKNASYTFTGYDANSNKLVFESNNINNNPNNNSSNRPPTGDINQSTTPLVNNIDDNRRYNSSDTNRPYIENNNSDTTIVNPNNEGKTKK